MYSPRLSFLAGVAQLVEQVGHNHCVAGSTPAPSSELEEFCQERRAVSSARLERLPFGAGGQRFESSTAH